MRSHSEEGSDVIDGGLVQLGGPFLPEESGTCLGLSRKELVSFVSGSRDNDSPCVDLLRSDGRARVVRLQMER